jgi:hypothetical protein
MASTNYKKTYISLSFLLPMLEHIPFAHCIESKQKCTKVLFKREFHLARLMNAYILFCLWDRDKILLYFIQRNCHTGGYCHTKCTWYYTYTDSNLIKIRSLSCFPLLICHDMGDLKKPHYGPHVSDLMSWIYNDIINHIFRPIRLLVACKVI